MTSFICSFYSFLLIFMESFLALSTLSMLLQYGFWRRYTNLHDHYHHDFNGSSHSVIRREFHCVKVCLYTGMYFHVQFVSVAWLRVFQTRSGDEPRVGRVAMAHQAAGTEGRASLLHSQPLHLSAHVCQVSSVATAMSPVLGKEYFECLHPRQEAGGF